MNQDSVNFIQSLKNNDLLSLQKIPKSDLHNHFVLGGNREYIKQQTGYDIQPIRNVLSSIQEMHQWNDFNLGNRFSTAQMRKLLIDATFVQAKADGVSILEIGEDVWGLSEFFSNDVDKLIEAFHSANKKFAPNVELRLQIGLSRHCPVDYLLDSLSCFWGRSEFYSIDLYGDEFAQPVENFIPIYRQAKVHGLRLKAHVGEWGDAEGVVKTIELLELDEVQHGISIAYSNNAIEFIRKNNIRLNITPTSNVKLGRVCSMADHPIGMLFRAGVNVTINSDDVLIFDSDVSKEYLSLYNQKVLSAEELDQIRINGLQKL